MTLRSGRSVVSVGFSRTVALLAIGHLLAFVDRAKIAATIPTIRQQMTMNDATAGWVIGGAFALGYGATIVSMSILAGSKPARWSWQLPVGLFVWGCASLLTGFSRTISGLLITRALVGCGQALFIPAALGLVVAVGDRTASRSASMAFFTAAASLGRSVGLLLLAMALIGVGWVGVGAANVWRGAFVITALPNAVLLFAIMARRSPIGPVEVVPITAAPWDWRQWAYLMLAVAPIILIQAIQGWAPTLFVTGRGVAPPTAAALLGVLTLVGGAGGQAIGGWLFQRGLALHGRVPLVVVVALVATLPAVALLAWGPGNVAASVGLLLAVLALGIASFAALFGWQQLIPHARRVTDNGVFLAFITVVGVGLGPLITGILADISTTLRWSLVVTAAGCIVIAGVSALLVRPVDRGRADA